MKPDYLAGRSAHCKRSRCARRHRPVRSRAVRSNDRLLRAYYLYQATASCVFFSPVFFVYYEERAGLALPTILWIQSYYVALRALLEMPLGAVADRYSRRACLTAYGVGHVAGAALVLAWPTFWGVVVAETIFALASASRSGADSALLYDTLAAAGRLGDYPRAESRAQAVIAFSSGETAVVGGLLAARDLRLPYVATMVAAAASGGVTWVLRAEARTANPPHVRLSRLVHDAARQAASSAAVRWVMMLAAQAVAASHVYYYLQQPFLRAVGVPLGAFGLVFFTTKAMTALVATAAHRVDTRLGQRGVALVMTGVAAGGLATMSTLTGAGVAALIVTRGVLDGLWQPLLNVYLNRLVPSELRATMLSAQSLVARLALSATLAFLGGSTARIGLAATLAVSAAMVVVLGTLLLLRAGRLPAPAVLAGAGACDSRGT